MRALIIGTCIALGANGAFAECSLRDRYTKTFSISIKEFDLALKREGVDLKLDKSCFNMKNDICVSKWPENKYPEWRYDGWVGVCDGAVEWVELRLPPRAREDVLPLFKSMFIALDAPRAERDQLELYYVERLPSDLPDIAWQKTKYKFKYITPFFAYLSQKKYIQANASRRESAWSSKN